jgi:hypothetical protein
MAVFRSILRVPIGDGNYEIHIVQEDRSPDVLMSLVRRSDKGSAFRLRPTVRIPKSDAMRIGKFLLGIREIDDVVTERIERETTQPGFRTSDDEETQP